MQIVIELSDSVFKRVRDDYVTPYEVDEMCDAILDSTPIPENATNGNMIMAMFPSAKVFIDERGDYHYVYVTIKNMGSSWKIRKEWWNSPYERSESE